MAALSITATNVVPVASPSLGTMKPAVFVYGIALAAMTAGQVAYEDTSTTPPSYGLCDADHATAAVRRPKGIVVGPAVAAGQQVAIQISGQLAMGSILTKGIHYVPGATAGALNPSADQTTSWNIASVGQALSTSVLDINPVNTDVQI